MAWMIALLLLVFVTALAAGFAAAARAIRRDFVSRFDRVQERLEHEANAVLRNLLSRSRPN